jgi:hypothetical protein
MKLGCKELGSKGVGLLPLAQGGGTSSGLL